MHDERMIGRPALGCEDATHRIGIRGVRTEPVHRLGRKGDQASCLQDLDCALETQTTIASLLPA